MKGISPLIAAVILIAFVIAVVGIASTFFTGFTSEQKAKVSNTASQVMDCSLAWFEIDKDVVNVGSTVSVIVENKGQSALTGLKIVVYNESGAFELDASPSSLEIGDVRLLQASYSGEPVLDKIKVTSTGCPGVEDSLDFTYSYQEDADDPDYCIVGGFDEICDGDWSTPEWAQTFTFHVNYTKPVDAVAAKWQIKYSGYPGPINITIPNSVWSYDPNVLHLQVYADDGVPEIMFYGLNETGWEYFGIRETVSDFYEEALWWNVIED